MTMWSPQKFSTENRLNIANEILEELQKKYGEKLVSVAIEGSTAKGLDYPESDLELRVVIQDGKNSWYPFFYKGMFIGISYNSIQKICTKAESIDYEWPVNSDTLFTSKLLYDPTNLYEKLRKKAQITEYEADYNLLYRDALADMYEHIYKVFSFKESEAESVANEARQVAYWAIMCVGLKNKVKFLSSRTMYQESFQLQFLPEGFKDNIQGLISINTNLKCLKENVSDLWSSFVHWTQTNDVKLVENDLSFL